jgi:hypothetical protein
MFFGALGLNAHGRALAEARTNIVCAYSPPETLALGLLATIATAREESRKK